MTSHTPGNAGRAGTAGEAGEAERGLTAKPAPVIIR